MLHDQARGARVQETKRAIARLLGTGGDQGQGTRPRSARDSGFHGLLQALSESGSTERAANAAGVANLKQTWDDLEPEGAFDLVLHCKLAEVYDPALSRLDFVISVAQHRFLVKLQAELWNGHCQQRSNIILLQHHVPTHQSDPDCDRLT